tara:strand:+ start:1890 stop:2738 length:849 start_codon:yes stop_codon:yes gene_type:complete
MEYKKGHKIKPKEILNNGVVIFTDGTDDVSPNQVSCEAYGYKWSRKSNTCYGFNSNFKINKLFENTTNTNIGAENSVEGAAMNTLINGNKNTAKGQNRNILINGESHQVENGLNNASIIGGTSGKIQRQSEVVIGGGIGTADYPLGNNQTSTVQLGGLTTNNTATKLTIQGDGTSYIAFQNNSVIGYEVKVIGICYGGSSGTAGDYKYEEIKGAIKIDNSGSVAFSQSTTAIASVGTTGASEMAAAGIDGFMTVEVTGTANVNIEWFASVQITENKLYSVTF